MGILACPHINVISKDNTFNFLSSLSPSHHFLHQYFSTCQSQLTRLFVYSTELSVLIHLWLTCLSSSKCTVGLRIALELQFISVMSISRRIWNVYIALLLDPTPWLNFRLLNIPSIPGSWNDLIRMLLNLPRLNKLNRGHRIHLG